MYKFRIPIGDWSDDGHGKCDWFTAESTKSMADIRKAYAKAKKKVKKEFWPTSFCNKQGVVPDAVLEYIDHEKDENGYYDFGTKEMAQYLANFLNNGDPELKIKLVETDLDMFIVSDGCIGYGLL